MNKEQFSKLLIRQQEKGRSLISLISTMHESQNDLGNGIVMLGGEDLYYVPEDELDEFLNKFKGWKSYVSELLTSHFSKDDQYVYDWNEGVSTYVSKRKPILNQLKKNVNNGLALLDSFIQRLDFHYPDGHVEIAFRQEKTAKPPMVFISHKKEDEAYADALVNLINFILGAGGQKIFCSSVPGYGIRLSGDILDELKAQFDRHDILMVIIHSPRYYKSAICLNEMGASWVLGTKFYSFMTKDCKYEHMHGVIGRENICVNLNDNEKTLNSHLNEFKDDLVKFFEAEEVDQSRWENARGRFINEVSALTYSQTNESESDLFNILYLPAFDHIFEMLNVDKFQSWAYPCAIGGNTYISSDVYKKLCQVPNYIMSRPKHKEYTLWDMLMRNLGLLVDDFTNVFSEHIVQLDNNTYIVERFYKRYMNNPNYEKDLAAYNEHVYLVSDLLFELARLCNLILSKIREKYPEYKKELGILHIDNRITASDLTYKEDEISDTPYPGLKEFIKVRMMRETHLGSNPNIDEGGYEH